MWTLKVYVWTKKKIWSQHDGYGGFQRPFPGCRDTTSRIYIKLSCLCPFKLESKAQSSWVPSFWSGPFWWQCLWQQPKLGYAYKGSKLGTTQVVSTSTIGKCAFKLNALSVNLSIVGVSFDVPFQSQSVLRKLATWLLPSLVSTIFALIGTVATMFLLRQIQCLPQ